MPDADEFQTMLRGANLRVTRPRLAVMQAVHDHPHAETDAVIRATRAHAETDAVIRATRAHAPDVSHQTVYDALNALTAAGLVRRIQPNGSLARYEARVGDNHHHVVCRTCGTIADVDCAVGEVPCLTASDDQGFVIDEAEVIYWGTCPTCAAEAQPTRTS